MLVKIWALVSVAVACAAAQEETQEKGGPKYDYIIVGGGTAGAALATRLSQGLPKSKILLLEAGPAAPDELRINVPGMRGAGLATIYDWNFTSIPQENINDRVIDVNRGKVLGGSSALNYLCYDRAASAEYDAWGELGSDGWDWDVMIEAMLKSENFTGDAGEMSVHGVAGPIRNTFNRVLPAQLETWNETLNSLGIPINPESLGGDPIGVMYQPTNIDTTHWTRSYSANSYLPLAGSNLKVMTDSIVAKVEFAKREKRKPIRATGVVLEDGTKFTARKEIILSAGSIGSPGLLELSGVGQPEVLQAAGVTPLLDLPGVGENYQDHIRTQNSYRLKDNYTSFDQFIYDSGNDFVAEQLQLWLDGEYSWFDYTSSAYGFVNWAQVIGDDSEELVALAEGGAGEDATAVDKKKLEFLKDASVPDLEVIMENNYVGAEGYPGGQLMTLFTSIMHPMSRGNVHIDPQDPLGKPIIDLNYFDNEYDMRAIIEGAKYCRKIAQTEPMASIWEAEYEPGDDVQTDEQWREFARKSVQSFYHPVGTCAMLPKEDGGVVDASLTVYGTSNLRIVDASIMPVVISAHIQTAVYGIAEVAAEMIIADAKK